MNACTDAGLKQIDFLVTTHFHSDHFGGILELSKRIPIINYYDKGALPSEHEQQTKWFKTLYPLYQQATKGNAKFLRVGEIIPLKNNPADEMSVVKLTCVAAEKKVIGFDEDVDVPVDGFKKKKPDKTDNARSLALLLEYGAFKFFAGADITWNVEHHLVHPINKIGEVDLYQVTHHGLDMSNNPLLVKALNPTVCIAMNGPKKGIQPRSFRTLKSPPGIQAIYQIHYNVLYGDEGNTSKDKIANFESPDKGEWIKVAAFPKQKYFTVSIGCDGQEQKYNIK